MSDKDVR